MASAARCVDDVTHRAAHDVEHRGVQWKPPFDNRRKTLDHRAVERLFLLDELRLVASAAVGDLSRDHRHLQWRRRDITLANRDRERFRRIPSLTEALLLPQ